MIRWDISQSHIFNEFTEKEQKQFFSVTGNKVVHNIDTLYYTAFLVEDEKKIKKMLNWLEGVKDLYQTGQKEDLTFGELEFVPFRFSIYEYCLHLENMFDIFISKYVPNENTPRVVVQLRSFGLWIDGAKDMVIKSCKALQTFLDGFGIEILRLGENRFDYAFHTNMIQALIKYFSDKNMILSLRTQLEFYSKHGNIRGKKITVDTLNLGKRKSNNVYFRAYNKTREVIEMNYKGFFIGLWWKNGLISEYDMWIMERAYELGTFNSLLVARIEWYLLFGHDTKLKEQLEDLKAKYYENSDNSKYIEKELKGLLPEVTIICNIEFQTKRKYYYSMDNFIADLPSSVDTESIYYRLFQIMDNPKVFLDHLTEYVVAFMSGENFASWWQRIRSLKIKSLSDSEVYRSYERHLDIKKQKQRTKGNIAAVSVYRNGPNEKTFNEDVSDTFSVLNDNDVHAIMIDADTGEMLNFDDDEKYKTVKKRKNRQLKSLFKDKERDL